MSNMFARFFGFVKRTVVSFLGNHCTMHAAGLTYYSMLAIVPILCLLLLAAKSFGAKEYIKEKIDVQFNQAISKIEAPPEEEVKVLAPVLGETAPEKIEEKRKTAQEFVDQARGIKDEVFRCIDGFDANTVGWIGLGLLVWSVLSSIGMIEISFNEIWAVERPRTFIRRLAVALAVVVVLPLLSGLALTAPVLKLTKDIIVATAGQTWLTKWVSDGVVWLIDLWVVRFAVTLFFSSVSFGYLFYIVPFRKVRWKCAWLSGIATAALFTGWLKLCTVAQLGIAKTSAMYGSFAFIPIVLAWIYMSWQIVLLGCCMSRSMQENS